MSEVADVRDDVAAGQGSSIACRDPLALRRTDPRRWAANSPAPPRDVSSTGNGAAETQIPGAPGEGCAGL